MKKRWVVGLVLLVVAAAIGGVFWWRSSTASQKPISGPPPGWKPYDYRVIRIGLKPKTDIDKFARQLGVERSAIKGPTSFGFVTIRVNTKRHFLEVKKRLAGNRAVTFTEPGVRYLPNAVPNDPYYNPGWLARLFNRNQNQWGLHRIDADRAWGKTKGSGTITVAVIDSGIDPEHPDLVDKIVAGYDFVDGDNSPSDNKIDNVDYYGHGTHVSGIAAASTNNDLGVAGLSWNSKIMPIRYWPEKMVDFTYEGHNLELETCEAGLIWAVEHGANVVNMSFGGFQFSHVMSVITKWAQRKGVVLVAASGNEETANVPYPAAYPGVISVGAVTENDTRATATNWGHTKEGKPKGSNFGPWLDVMAPGNEILSTVPEKHGYDKMTGTSMATPYVSGLAALILSLNPKLTPSEVANVIEKSADKVPAMNGKDRTDEYGYGRINAARAVQMVSPVAGKRTPVDESLLEVARKSAHNSATMLVMDVSGSMGDAMEGSTKMEAAKTAAETLVGIIERQTGLESLEHQVGLTSFSEDVKDETDLSTDPASVKTAIRSLSPDSGTNLGAGLKEALRQFDFEGDNIERILIVLSDGQSNTGLSNEDILSGPVAKARASGVKIYTVGFGERGNLDEAFLRRIATATGGEYKYANRAYELENVYIQIRQKYIGASVASFGGKMPAGSATKQLGVLDLKQGVGELHATLNWYGAPLNADLLDPDGVEVTDDYVGATLYSDEKPNYYVIRNPKPGFWMVAVKRTGVDSAAPAASSQSAAVQNEYNMLFSVRKHAMPLRDYPYILGMAALVSAFTGSLLFFIFRRNFKLEAACPGCGRPNLATDAFCAGCGTAISAKQQPA